MICFLALHFVFFKRRKSWTHSIWYDSNPCVIIGPDGRRNIVLSLDVRTQTKLSQFGDLQNSYTTEAVQAAGELLVRLKETEECVITAHKRAMDAEQAS
ncbi:hypothetical protein Fmac_008607 [Flemingia macrophylla]|uniref:Uncharacterized protein n=1 Tax=Flemingia macrophylla TaxID=520843 RepID=A0ABD1MYS1_9FABA